MITAILTQLSDGSLLVEHPNIWERKQAACRRSIIANIRGRRVEVFVGFLSIQGPVIKCLLWYYNNYKDAEDFDERTGQVVVASTPADCIKWIKSYTPRGSEQDYVLDFYSGLHFPTFVEQRQASFAKETVIWEQEQREATALWFAREEARLNAEAASLEESDTKKVQEKFPLEIETEPLLEPEEDSEDDHEN
jgi:hypothetical protein